MTKPGLNQGVNPDFMYLVAAVSFEHLVGHLFCVHEILIKDHDIIALQLITTAVTRNATLALQAATVKTLLC